ncbi:Nin one binding Zn-ribbon like-domain-containing protein [Abortiporus biennis]|nr:Nin one binding Zn-ribbon like-domain-containing protein [Abortiporus biennis]
MTTSSTTTSFACKNLVLDAGPLLSLSPLRGLAENFYTVPQVLEELKDKNAREHFRKLGLSAGVKIQVETPDAASLAHVIQFAKKTGDYSVLSHPDLCVLALTYMLDERYKEHVELSPDPNQTQQTLSSSLNTLANDSVEADVQPEDERVEEPPMSDEESPVDDEALGDDKEREELDVKLEPILNDEEEEEAPPLQENSTSLYDDPSDEDDGEGEWITPSNVGVHKSRALHLLPDDDTKKGKISKAKQIGVGCMTADFAMQNVLLQMGLSLVGVEGKRIERVKTWVLRCHACFKICKDNSRKFCPSCGNPTLLRASVTLSSPTATASTPILQVHLKKNFQYKTRGTIYSIPAPKAGSAKTGSGEGLILREDQTAWVRAKKHADIKREKEEKRMLNGAVSGKGDGTAVLSSWMDPDWVPEILSTGTGGKGRNVRRGGMDGDMPVVGYGKKNPNERKRRK